MFRRIVSAILWSVAAVFCGDVMSVMDDSDD